jgi:site-specific DNA-adenine methylase
VNKEGKFNVPMGSYTDPGIYDETTLYNDAKALSGVTLKQHSYLQCPIEKEDFVYLDPPYHKLYAQYDSGGLLKPSTSNLPSFAKTFTRPVRSSCSQIPIQI